MNPNFSFRLLSSFFILLIVLSCNDDKGKNIPSVSTSDVETSVIDFRPYTRNPDGFQQGFENHPVMSEIFFGHILALPIQDSTKAREGFQNYLDIEATENIAALIDSVYPNLNSVEEEWTLAMAYYHHYFPSATIPSLYVLQTNLGIANFLFEDKEGRDAVGASLDFFLGDAFPYLSLARDKPAFSEYNNRTFNRDHLITKSVNALIDDMVGAPLEKNLITSMIREGKRLYILEAVCAEISDTAVFEYSRQDLEWCEQNELEIWNFFIEKELVYETDLNEFGKYLRPAPNSPGMPQEAPGKTAAFVGYKIVSAYMDRNPSLSLTDLARLDNEKLYKDSNYKPRRR